MVKKVDLPQANKASVPLDVNAPQLRLNTEMHTSSIRSSVIDKQQRYLVTASHDKTARVWSLETGELLQVLRVPIIANDKGKLYAVAISPDGEIVAVAGMTHQQGNEYIYLFKRSTGKLIKRLSGLPNVVLHLAYSKQGDYLVASLFGKNGIRVYDTQQYQRVFSDSDYGNNSYWAEFAEDGRLVTSSDDGYLRLYHQKFISGSNFKLPKKQKLTGGKEPFVVSFSPLADKIAVGFADSTKVNVLSSKDLSLLYSPNTERINNRDLSKVAWSADGKRLFAGGRYYDGVQCPVITWQQQGQGKRQSWRVGVKSTLMSLLALKDNSLLVASQDPLWIRIKADGTTHLFNQQPLLRQSEIANFRGVFLGQFILSENANQLSFGTEYRGKQSVAFDIIKQQLTQASAVDTELTSALIDTSLFGFDVTNWLNDFEPKFDDDAINLKPYEFSRSLAIAHDGKHFLLGTEWYLRYFNDKGKQQWKLATPSVVWGVNIAANNKVAVAAFADGTIRWYDLTKDKAVELLALFVHSKDKRWVL